MADVEGGDIACSGRAVGYGDANSSSAGSAGRQLEWRSTPECPVPTRKPILSVSCLGSTDYAVSKKMCVTDAVKEAGSGRNGHPKGLLRRLRDPAAQTIVVDDRDRLLRFGFEYGEAVVAAQGRKIVVI